MPRFARLVIPDQPHHIAQRGHYQQQIFCSDADRQMYLDLVVDAANRAQVRLWGWCLMTNHVHWIAVPTTGQGLSIMLRRP